MTVGGPGGGSVQFTNPWGDDQVMSLQAFQSRVASMSYDPSTVSYSVGQMYAQQGLPIPV